jgi:hypothetical protein
VRYFFDNTLPPRIAKAIGALLDPPDVAVHLTDEFSANAPDVEWLDRLGKQGDWIIISGDPRIVRSPHERKAWQTARLTTFFLKKGWTNVTFWQQAAQLVRWWPDIMNQAKRVAPGAAFLVPLNYSGRFEQLRLPS